jgi:hypothetical protein
MKRRNFLQAIGITLVSLRLMPVRFLKKKRFKRWAGMDFGSKETMIVTGYTDEETGIIYVDKVKTYPTKIVGRHYNALVVDDIVDTHDLHIKLNEQFRKLHL